MTRKVLYAEDDRIQAVVVSSLLTQAGFTVTRVENGRSALDAVCHTVFDVVLSDHYMPEMNGVELLSEMRARNIDVPLVLMTSTQDMQLVFSAVRAGADDFISKDMKGQYLELIVPVLDRVCERHQLQARVRRHAQQLQQEKNLCFKTLDAMEQGVLVLDDGLHITYLNSFFCALFNVHDRESLLGAGLHFFVELLQKLPQHSGRNWGWLDTDVLSAWLEEDGGALEIIIAERFLEVKKVKVADTGFAITFTDISAQKLATRQIEHIAHHDELTGLPNRTLMHDRMRTALRRVHRTGNRMGVLVLDLDHFKRINDSLGHFAGDELLKTVAIRLVSAVRDSDTVCRMGGDEFVVILPDIGGRDDIETVCEKILHLISQPIDVGFNVLNVTPSIGLSMAPDDGDSAEDLLKHADIAMYRAKQTGRNGYHVFTHDLARSNQTEMAIEQALHLAFKRNGLQIFYQPKVNIETRQVLGFEALIRWFDPVYGTIAPDRFIPMAETTGYIIKLGEWVLQQACSDMQRLRLESGLDYRVSVNVSPRQLEHPDFITMTQRVLAASGLPPCALELEMTEGMLVSRSASLLEKLNALHDMGVLLAIDDFGTGYCSLSYVAQYPIDVIKIDRCFIDVNQKTSRAIVGAITTIAHGLGLEVVAEGIETLDQIALVRERGCNVVQGFYFYQAMSLAELHPVLPQVHHELERKLALN